jgi:hypothetical protein
MSFTTLARLACYILNDVGSLPLDCWENLNTHSLNLNNTMQCLEVSRIRPLTNFKQYGAIKLIKSESLQCLTKYL